MISAMVLSLVVLGNGPVVRVDRLRCGDANLRMTTSVSADRAAPLAPVSQALIDQSDSRSTPVPLEPGHSVVLAGHRVRDRYAASWACLTGARHTYYILIGYACAVDPGLPGDCGGDKEWFRLLDGRGRFADTGVPHDGPARERLYARLGIADTMAAGVTMTSLID